MLDSVHAFTEGVIGPLFLGFIALVALISLALIGWRSDRLYAPGKLDAPVSREAAFIVNNLLFVGLTFTVLLGTTFPLIIEAIRGDRISVGPPYFNMVAAPIGLALLFLMGVGPALPWRRASGEKLKRAFTVPLIAGVAVMLLAVALGMRAVYPLITLAFAGFVMGTIVEEFRKGLVARMRIAGRSPLLALADLFVRNGRRYGGYVVHVGVVIIAVALSISGTWKTEREVTLRPGESFTIEGFNVEFQELWGEEQPQRFVVGGTFLAYRGDRFLGEQTPRLNYYPSQQQPIATPSVKTSPTRDLYLTLMAFDEQGEHATVRAIVNPAVAWLWIGGMIMALGSIVAIVPWRPRSQRAAVEDLVNEVVEEASTHELAERETVSV